MLRLELEEGEVRETPRFRKDGDTHTLILRLHGFDKDYVPHLLKIVWREGGEEIRIIASKESLEEIKKFLVKRDTPMDILWSLIQYEYATMDKLEEKVEKLQNASLHSYSSQLMESILKVKKTLFIIHRDYIRLRNLLEWSIERGNSSASDILRDVNELIYGVEYLIEGTTTAIQLMQNTISVKMNQTMKILTIIATIMMPLTLITGIYGMNFVNMPEIKWEYGYYYSLLLMLLVAVGMLLYFKKKKLL